MLKELMDSGRDLLLDRPMDRERYLAWSDGARERISAAYGPTSPQATEFVKARWEIATSIDVDPSYYYTQLAANLRREIRVMEKLEREGGPPDVPLAAPPSAPPAASSPSAPPAAASRPSPPPRPSPSRSKFDFPSLPPPPPMPDVFAAPAKPRAAAPAPAAPTASPRSVFILPGADAAAAERLSSAVEGRELAPVEVDEKYREALAHLGSAGTAREIAAAFVFIDPDPKSRGSTSSPKPDCLLDLGVLTGALGPEKVVALVASGVSMPRLPRELRQIRLGESDDSESDIALALDALKSPR